MVQIGRTRPSEDLVDLLLACHGRIRSFVALAIAIGERADATDDDVAQASASVHRYFSIALPLHVEDEELGILSRLHGRSPEVDAALDRMCDEHDRHTAPLRRLLALCTALQVEPGDLAARAALADVAGELATEFGPHLKAEETIVFPAIAALLSADEQRAVVRELRARRQPP